MSEEETIPYVCSDDCEIANSDVGDDEPMILRGFIKYPPQQWDPDTPPNLTVSEVDTTKHENWAAMASKDSTWMSTGNPVNAVESLILHHEADLFPSVRVMKWLAEGFEDWHNHQGEKSLEQCLGLRKPSGQAANMMKEASREELIESLMLEISRLRYAFGITQHKAAEMVETRLQETDWNKSRHDLPNYTALSLMGLYKKSPWARYQGRDKTYWQELSNEEKWSMLAEYPFYCWEQYPKLKHFSKWMKAHVSKSEWNDPEKLKTRKFKIS